MGFLIAWRIVCSRASPGKLKRTKRINQICYNQLDAPLKVWTLLYHVRSSGRVKEIGLCVVYVVYVWRILFSKDCKVNILRNTIEGY